jgi:octaprenyl-diphosphate synthase
MIAVAVNDLGASIAKREIVEELSRQVALVESELHLQMRSKSELVGKVASHTLEAGGKRLRPAFVAIGAMATGKDYDEQWVVEVGASMEMIHMATLIHDDVIDNSSTRRGRPTAAALFGNRASILSGDALLAKATVLISSKGQVDLINLLCQAVLDMAEGEVKEVEVRGDLSLHESTHFEILRLKTASFIAACCEAGGVIANATQESKNALRVYGNHVGLAFQLVDDLLDYRGDLSKTGKPIGADFREGQATLPLIYLREELNQKEHELLKARFGEAVSLEEIRMICNWMASRGVFQRCEAVAMDHVRKAMDAAERLPNPAARDVLNTVAEQIVQRQS